ncbi:hypothetical protein LOK49_LG05G03173 [Camellia lanceoleosa]|uniref:Uncharacterized protein n=1 Tax=Camellia lanceoleosa TaxID=1840588 RepID=A0ACC0HID6_9ERIC|nr:hypothetical protein LOK49_LG05G03173 [Camellia lanceoleosa]
MCTSLHNVTMNDLSFESNSSLCILARAEHRSTIRHLSLLLSAKALLGNLDLLGPKLYPIGYWYYNFADERTNIVIVCWAELVENEVKVRSDKWIANCSVLEQVDVPIYAAGTGVKPAEIARQGLEEAKRKNMDVVIVDTTGRLQFGSIEILPIACTRLGSPESLQLGC